MGIECRVFDVFGIEIWVSLLQGKKRAGCSKSWVSKLWSDTYWWRRPVEKDSSVANCLVALDDEPDAEGEEESDGDEGVDGRLWV